MKTWPSPLEEEPGLRRACRPPSPRNIGGEQRPAGQQRGGVPRTALRGRRVPGGTHLAVPRNRDIPGTLQATRTRAATRLSDRWAGGGVERSALQWVVVTGGHKNTATTASSLYGHHFPPERFSTRVCRSKESSLIVCMCVRVSEEESNKGYLCYIICLKR